MKQIQTDGSNLPAEIVGATETTTKVVVTRDEADDIAYAFFSEYRFWKNRKTKVECRQASYKRIADQKWASFAKWRDIRESISEEG